MFSVARVTFPGSRVILGYSRAGMASLTNSREKIEKATKLLNVLKDELESLKKMKTEEMIKHLEKENESLHQQVKAAIGELIRLETVNGKRQIPVPNQDNPAVSPPTEVALPETARDEQKSKPVKDAKAKKSKPAAEKPVAEEAQIDVGRLDFRVGKIIEVNKHPDADSLYVEKVDCGEPNPRTVVSGLVNHISIDQMQNRLVVLLCNLKPVKMRGVTSEAMVMCASSPAKVEILSPPPGSQPGDLVHCEGYARKPDPQLNPKKKIFETCAPDLLTNSNKEACYKDIPLFVPEKGKIVSQTLIGVNVK